LQKGLFITLEGGEGTGKSTQLKLLQAALEAAGVSVVTTREPGGTPQAERIRDLLLQRDSGRFDPLTEALLLFAARREHIVEKIRPALQKGQWVISDRFADSSRAFQGYGMGLGQDVIDRLYALTAEGLEPDITFIFDIEPQLGLERSLSRLKASGVTEDRYERMGLPFHERLRAGFRDIAKRFPGRCVMIDAAQDVESIHRQMLQTIAARTGLAAKEAQRG